MGKRDAVLLSSPKNLADTGPVYKSFLYLLSPTSCELASADRRPDSAYVSQQLALMACWPDIKGLFSAGAQEKMEAAYNLYLSASRASDTGYQEALAALRQRMASDAPLIQLSDLNGPGDFFAIHKTLSRELSEESKVSAIAYWEFMLFLRYDSKRSQSFIPGNRTANDVVARYSEGVPAGICGDINGTFARKLAESLGLKALYYGVNSPHAEASVAAIITGKKALYLADAGEAYVLSRNLDAALEQVDFIYKRVTPFSAAIDPGMVFYRRQSEDFLLKSMDWYADWIRKGFSVDFDVSAAGAVSLASKYAFRHFTFGVMVLKSPLALEEALGGFVNFRAQNAAGGSPLCGFVPLEAADLAAFSAKAGADRYPLFLGRFIPLAVHLWADRRLEVRLNPYAGEYGLSASSITSVQMRHRSKLGFLLHHDGNATSYFDIESAYAAGPEMYGSVSTAFKGTLGFRNESLSAEVFAAPGNLQGRYGLEAGAKAGRLPVFFMADFSFTDFSGRDISGSLTAQVSVEDLARDAGKFIPRRK